MSDADVVVVLSTVPLDVAATLVDRLLEARLCACVNQIGPVRSRYLWEGAIETAEEMLLVLKTTASRVRELRDRLSAWHPYEVPEILEFDVSGGLPAYLGWVAAECRPSP